ncbi:MAG: phenylalanine--tRNA ligase subunit beta [Acidimicrobiales bacterium]
MKVLLSWLREFAPIDCSPTELAEQLSDLGLAVESMDRLGADLDGIVVAEVLALRPHPDADKVQLVEVDLGDGEALQIVCGAFNMAVGDRVPLATLGTTMPNGMRIERRKLRGELSNGMLCSATELGLGDDHSGILILPGTPSLGTPIPEALGIVDDVLYDLEVNPNRPDAMSVAGVARDVAARLGVPFTQLDPQVTTAGADLGGRASVSIHDADLCGRFLARVLDGVTVGESPAWLANRLTLLGMRPINSIVDISNYVMLELGQPNHTYDLAKVSGGHLGVRWARDGERIVTLDDVERTLTSGDGVIVDADDVAIGIAGVMGGASTEISDATTSVLLEMAWWQPMAIARSSARLGLRSEASMRFERGADPEVLELAARRFAQLAAEAGATLAPGTVVVDGDLPDRSPIAVRTRRVSDLLGSRFTGEQIRGLLEPIGFGFPGPADGADGTQQVAIPSYRFDSATETDVVEEVARMHGYSRLGSSMPPAARFGSLTPRQRDRRLLREVLVGLAVDEAMPMPFLAPVDLERTGLPGEAATLLNPLAVEESVLRTSLRPGLLRSLAYNASHRTTGVALFEIGKVWTPDPGGGMPAEREVLAVALAASAAGGIGDDAAARHAVRVLDTLVEALALHGITLEQVAPAGLHPTRSGDVLLDGVAVGAVGEVDPAVLAEWAIPERVAVVELDLDALLAAPHGERPYGKISRYPSSDIDLAFVVDDTVSAAAVEATIRAAGGDDLVRVALFDVFRGAQLGDGRRSLAFSLRLQATDRTLTDSEVGELRQRVIDAVAAAHDATLRS